MLSIKNKILLFPYWATLKVRHFLYDKGIKKSVRYGLPVICIGNITVGGTGKTPHTEMILREMGDKARLAVLSRGYRRKTKGFRLAREGDTYEEIGDEPLQIKQKFPNVTLAVCADRREGIARLLEDPAGKPDAILLDDAFQHRRIRPSHSVVLMNFNNPIQKDNLLPIGSLRDLPEQIRRADSIIVTKSPLFGEHDGIIDDTLAAGQIAPFEQRWREELELREDQQLYFSIIRYGEPLPLFPEADSRYTYAQGAVFFTGIANDAEFHNHIMGRHRILDSLKFPDHRNFSARDIRHISDWAAKYPTAAIYTTEKDSKRLMGNTLFPKEIRKRLFYIPIEVEILPRAKKEQFIGNLMKMK